MATGMGFLSQLAGPFDVHLLLRDQDGLCSDNHAGEKERDPAQVPRCLAKLASNAAKETLNFVAAKGSTP
ncbi:hypothetical protein [Paenarthrobacter sp. NPDC091669]|uniref:hypothetical protein n=1 Tax=Paenarthrobacter sp. NPDC091669 TaxID=3364384 RepID=UPI003824223C